MKRIILGCILVCIVQYAQGQIGIGTSTPDESSVLEVSSSDKGVLAPRLTEAQRDGILNPAKGLIIYNLTENCLQINSGTTSSPYWSCIGDNSSALVSVFSDCNVNGFEGVYSSGITLTSANKFSVTITNNTFGTITMDLSTGDLVLSGVGGVSVWSVSSSSITLNSGASQIVEYTLSGTPLASGILTGKWTKLGLTCITTVDIP